MNKTANEDNIELTPYEKALNDAVKNMKKNSMFKAVIKKHKVTDDEIKANLMEFFNIYNNLSKMHLIPVVTEIRRDKNKKIFFEQVFSKEKPGQIAKIKQNTWFSDISQMSYEVLEKELMLRTKSRQRLEKYKIFLDALEQSFGGYKDLKSFYIYGKSGVGKTFILSYFAKYFALQNYKIAYISTPKLFQYIINEIKKSNNDAMDIKEKLKIVDILFIDDLGDEKDSAWFRTEFMGQIISDRIESKKVTFFASSMSVYNLERLYLKQNFNSSHVLSKIFSRIKRSIEFEIELTSG